MNFLLMPKAILTKNKALMAYRLRYLELDDYADFVSLSFLRVIDDLGLDALTGGVPLFVPINTYSLLADISEACTQPPSKIVFLLDGLIPPKEPYLSAIKELRSLGFSFSIENVPDLEAFEPIIQMCDYIMVDFATDNTRKLTLHASLSAKYKKHIFIATDVNSDELFNQLQKKGFSFFEGSFYTLPLPHNRGAMSPVKINRVMLLNIVNQPDFDINDVIEIVSRDPSMTLSLLKLVNSPYIGILQEIKSIPQAVALLGQVEVRKWVLTVIVSKLAEDKPSELVRTSLFRAKFAEGLAKSFGIADLSSMLFLMGLFSILDAAMDLPMKQALEKVKISGEIKRALIHRQGVLAPVLDFVFAYEMANWHEVNEIIQHNNIEPENVFSVFMDTTRWYGWLLKAVAYGNKI
ncbi:MAG: HDOD domain-containing protein [Defluviitaleaceae bacterium]|nr:HDOD domain-containing protein [Defluviitaleaceae bacterium]